MQYYYTPLVHTGGFQPAPCGLDGGHLYPKRISLSYHWASPSPGLSGSHEDLQVSGNYSQSGLITFDAKAKGE